MFLDIDKHNKTLIVTTIELLLNYCVRFYDRQFITRDNVNKDILVRFEKVLDDYYQSDKPQTLGFKYPQHFSRMFKKSVGFSPMEYRLLN
jgi:YesN/AraC family two-component response regulator